MEFNIKNFINMMKPFVDQAHSTTSNIVEHPFFQSPQTGDTWKFGQLSPNAQEMLSSLITQYSLPKEISYLYLGLKDEKKSFVYKRFTFTNLETTLKQAKFYQSYQQNIFVDLAMTYAGMGHCWIVAWHSEKQKYFMRLDGGANGYDYDLNHKKYIRNKINWDKLAGLMMVWTELKDFMDQEYNGDDFDKFQKLNIGNIL
jgi:hypothetical protein